MNGDQFRKLALSLPDTSEKPHFDRSAFRTPKRIFATLSGDGRSVNVLLDLDQQSALVESRPDAFEVIAGGWGRQGWTKMTLAALSVAEARAVLADAHARTNAGARKPAKPKRAAGQRKRRSSPPAQLTGPRRIDSLRRRAMFGAAPEDGRHSENS